MKTLILILTIVCTIHGSIALAGNYYEIEEWESDSMGVAYDPGYEYDRVYYYDSHGRKRYTTRYDARRRGLTPYKSDALLLPGGKYKREVRHEEKKGILTTILEILL